jgi:hypothetical protein
MVISVPRQNVNSNILHGNKFNFKKEYGAVGGIKMYKLNNGTIKWPPNLMRLSL